MSWINTGLTAATIGSSFFGKKNKKGSTFSQVPMQSQGQQQLGDQLSKYFSSMFGQGGGLANYQPGQAYTGQLSAGATGAENNAQALLQKYMQGSGTGDLFKQASGQISDTLSGKYSNPITSPYIQAMSDLSNRNLSGQIDQSRAGAGARGNFFSSQAAQGENRLRGDSQATMNAVIGDWTNQERGRQFDAAQIGQQFDEYQNQTIPLNQINAGSTYGALGRNLQQADYERQYQDFLRQRGEQNGAIGQAQQHFGQQIPYGTMNYTEPNSQQNNTFGSIMDIIGKLNGANFGGQGGQQGGIQQLLGMFGGGGNGGGNTPSWYNGSRISFGGR